MEMKNHRFLMFDEYSGERIAEPDVYAALLEEHLSANKPYRCTEKWRKLLQLDAARLRSMISVCDYTAGELQRRYERLYSVWENIVRASQPSEDLYSPFICLLEHMNRDGRFELPQGDSTPPARQLLEETTGHAFPVLKRFYAARADKSVYPGFETWLLAEGYSLLFSEYPFLFRLIADGFSGILQHLKSIRERVRSDRQEIAEAFGIQADAALVRVQTGLSDRHNHGQSVAVLHFSDGKKLLYKPRDLAMDIFWAEFLDGLFAREDAAEIRLRGIHALSKGTYGYTEYIEYEPRMDAAELSRYYSRCGALLSVAAMLGGTDLHYENLIVSDGMPLLVDTETLLTPWSKACYAANSGSERLNPPSLAVGRSLLLSKWVGQTADGAVNIGAFCSSGTHGRNVPQYPDGTAVCADDFSDRILRSYRAMNDLLSRRQTYVLQKLNELAEVPIRFVLRNTRTYVELLQYFTNLRGLTNGNAYECVTARVYSAFLLSCSEAHLRELLPLLREEHAAVKRRDIPVYYSHGGSRHLYHADGSVLVRDFFEYAPIEAAARNLAAITPDFTAQTSRYIQMTLALEHMQTGKEIVKNWSYLDGKHRAAPLTASTQADYHSALQTAERLTMLAYEATRRTRLDPSAFMFYSPKRDMRNGRYSLEVLEPSLYSGAYGVACFLDVFGAHFGRAELSTEIDRRITDWEQALSGRPNGFCLMDLSLAEGLAGFFLTVRNHALITHTPVRDSVAGLIEKLTAEDLQCMQNTDYFTGLSGLLYSICELAGISLSARSASCVQTIRLISEMLMRGRTDRGWFCAQTDYAPLTGLAHGQIGHALALTAALPYLENAQKQRALCCIRDAVVYEEACLDRECFNLPDFRKFQIRLRDAAPGRYIKRFMHGNCSGIVGTTEAVLRMQTLLEGSDSSPLIPLNADRWIGNAMQYLSGEALVGNDSLCCGTAAWLDLLCQIAKPGRYEARAKERIASILNALNTGGVLFNGLPAGMDDISLFKGCTGLGYVCLRLLGQYPQIEV